MGRICCLLGICCAPAAQLDAIAESLTAEGLSEEDARTAAVWITTHADLAPRGTLTELKDQIAAMVKAHTSAGPTAAHVDFALEECSSHRG